MTNPTLHLIIPAPDESILNESFIGLQEEFKLDTHDLVLAVVSEVMENDYGTCFYEDLTALIIDRHLDTHSYLQNTNLKESFHTALHQRIATACQPLYQFYHPLIRPHREPTDIGIEGFQHLGDDYRFTLLREDHHGVRENLFT